MRALLAFAIALVAAPALAAPSALDYVGQCVPFARLVSGIQIYGDAWTWWDAADGKYARGHRPRPGAVLVFRPTDRMKLGHVAVVSRIVDARVVMVTHANWSRIGGERGRAEQDVTMTDASPANDWSAVRVWYRDNDGLGGSTYPTYGFIYGERPAGGAVAKVHQELTGRDPDYVGSLIDAYR